MLPNAVLTTFLVFVIAISWMSVLADSLFIGAFNIQVFGKSKMSKKHVVEILVKIVQRYDLVLIQEIRDIDEGALPKLVGEVNKSMRSGNYEYIMGPRVGRSRTKEQYAFIYLKDVLHPITSYQYNDRNDIFEREPYVVHFQTSAPVERTRKSFVFIPLHAKPDDAIAELNGLVKVYEDAVLRTGQKDAVIAGDLNADCNYVCTLCWSQVLLKKDRRFSWLIGDNEDSTSSKTDCAYDRIIVTASLVGNSYGANVFRFDKEYGLSMTEAKQVSDHYPVEFYIS